MNKDKITITELVSKTFDEVYPEDECNKGLSKYKWSCGRNRHKYYSIPRHCFGFYDWFCNDFALRGKAKRLFSITRSIHRNNLIGHKFDPSKCYVFFKNNCPLYGDGKCYDDIRICDKESGDVIFNVCPRDPYGNTVLYFEGHGFENGTYGIKFNNMRELEKWFAM